jgi:hypothetical protein
VLSGLLLSLAAFVVGIFLAEVALHVLDTPPDRQEHKRLFIEHDPVLGWRNIPNAGGRIVTDEYAHELRYNARSMRGPLIPYERRSGVYRVLLLGDSFVDGYTEVLGNRVGDVLQRDLADEGISVEVIPMGTAGFSTDQEYLWLTSEGLRYRPDLVVLAFHPNDVWYNRTERYARGYKPHFILQSDALELAGVPVPPPDVDQPQDEGLYAWIRGNSKLYWLLARAVQNNPRVYGLAVELGLAFPPPEMVFDASRGVVTAGEFSIFNTHPPVETLEAWRITRALVARMRDDATSAGAGFLVFVIPIRSRIYTQDNDVRSNAAARNAEVDLDAPVRQFQDLCEAEAIAYIDPTAAFVQAADRLAGRGERLYYRYDWHWNANGHRLAGEILARRLRPMLAARGRPGAARVAPAATVTRDDCGSLGSTQ